MEENKNIGCFDAILLFIVVILVCMAVLGLLLLR